MRFVKPNENGPGGNGFHRGPSRSEIAQLKKIEAAIESARAKYIVLKCGHYTDWDTDLVYEVFRPLGPIKHYCEICGKWLERAIPAKPETLPNEPMF